MQTILIAVDLSEISAAIVRHALQLAEPQSSELHLLHVTPSTHYVPSNVNGQVLRAAVADELCVERHKLHEMAVQIRGKGYSVYVHQVAGNASHTITAVAEKVGADQIVMGTHQHSDAYHLLMGGVGNRVKRNAGCPVLLVPPARFSAPG